MAVRTQNNITLGNLRLFCVSTSFQIGELLSFLDRCTLTTHTLAHLWDLSLAGGMMRSRTKSLCCLTTYDLMTHTKLCAPFLVHVFLVTSFKCRFSVTIKESLMNKESATDVLLILSRMKRTLFWIVLMLSWSAYAINSSTCLMPYQQIALLASETSSIRLVP